MSIAQALSAVEAETIELRRDFHRHPELGLQEFRTAEKVAAYLSALGLEVTRLKPTGVCGLLTGPRPGPTLLLRADMDALPIREEAEVPFRSQTDGVMHACGHDAHMAILLSAAKVLSACRAQLPGNIKFVFEPNEENVGALSMIEQGVMEDPLVDACMGLHVWTPLPVGHIGLCAGPIMAGMEHFELAVKGRGGHTATPHSAVDPVLAAASVIQAVQAVQTREIDVLKEPTLIMFGQVHGGSASNVIPDQVLLSGTLRYLFGGAQDHPSHPRNRFERIVAGICHAHRTDYDLSFVFGHPTLVNHPEMVELVQTEALSRVQDHLEVVPVVTLAGEDFSEFAARAPSVFFFIGAARGDAEPPPHHHPRFEIDETALKIGVALTVHAVLAFFDKTDRLEFLRKGGGKNRQ